MSTELIPIGNHNIVFKGRNYKDVAIEIKQKLDNINFVNAEYFRLSALQVNSSNPRAIRAIKNQKEWVIWEEDEYYSFSKDKYLEFDVPYGFNLTFDEAKITFFEPSVASYWLGTCKCDYHPWRNEWRKFMCQVVTHFGGDKVIYLADNAHPLEEYVYIYEGSFYEIETLIKEKFGEPKGLFEYEIDDIDYDMYFVDDFKTIDWEQNVELESYLPEPDDTSDTNFDLDLYKSKEQLQTIKFDDKTLLYKMMDNKIHFFHLCRYKGLLCIHKGIINESENIEVKTDKYAPFIYDEIENQLLKDGFGHKLLKTYLVKIHNSKENAHNKKRIESLSKKILWSGYGGKNESEYSGDISKYFFMIVDEENAISTFVNLIKNSKLQGVVEIFHLQNEEEILVYKNK